MFVIAINLISNLHPKKQFKEKLIIKVKSKLNDILFLVQISDQRQTSCRFIQRLTL